MQSFKGTFESEETIALFSAWLRSRLQSSEAILCSPAFIVVLVLLPTVLTRWYYQHFYGTGEDIFPWSPTTPNTTGGGHYCAQMVEGMCVLWNMPASDDLLCWVANGDRSVTSQHEIMAGVLTFFTANLLCLQAGPSISGEMWLFGVQRLTQLSHFLFTIYIARNLFVIGIGDRDMWPRLLFQTTEILAFMQANLYFGIDFATIFKTCSLGFFFLGLSALLSGAMTSASLLAFVFIVLVVLRSYQYELRWQKLHAAVAHHQAGVHVLM